MEGRVSTLILKIHHLSPKKCLNKYYVLHTYLTMDFIIYLHLEMISFNAHQLTVKTIANDFNLNFFKI